MASGNNNDNKKNKSGNDTVDMVNDFISSFEDDNKDKNQKDNNKASTKDYLLIAGAFISGCAILGPAFLVAALAILLVGLIIRKGWDYFNDKDPKTVSNDLTKKAQENSKEKIPTNDLEKFKNLAKDSKNFEQYAKKLEGYINQLSNTPQGKALLENKALNSLCQQYFGKNCQELAKVCKEGKLLEEAKKTDLINNKNTKKNPETKIEEPDKENNKQETKIEDVEKQKEKKETTKSEEKVEKSEEDKKDTKQEETTNKQNDKQEKSSKQKEIPQDFNPGSINDTEDESKDNNQNNTNNSSDDKQDKEKDKIQESLNTSIETEKESDENIEEEPENIEEPASEEPQEEATESEKGGIGSAILGAIKTAGKAIGNAVKTAAKTVWSGIKTGAKFVGKGIKRLVLGKERFQKSEQKLREKEAANQKSNAKENSMEKDVEKLKEALLGDDKKEKAKENSELSEDSGSKDKDKGISEGAIKAGFLGFTASMVALGAPVTIAIVALIALIGIIKGIYDLKNGKSEPENAIEGAHNTVEKVNGKENIPSLEDCLKLTKSKNGKTLSKEDFIKQCMGAIHEFSKSEKGKEILNNPAISSMAKNVLGVDLNKTLGVEPLEKENPNLEAQQELFGNAKDSLDKQQKEATATETISQNSHGDHESSIDTHTWTDTTRSSQDPERKAPVQENATQALERSQANKAASIFNKTKGTEMIRSEDLFKAKEKYNEIGKLPVNEQQAAFLSQFKKDSQQFFRQNIDKVGTAKDINKNVDIVDNTKKFNEYNKELFDFYKIGNPALRGMEYPQFGGVSANSIKAYQEDALDLVKPENKTPEEQNKINEYNKESVEIERKQPNKLNTLSLEDHAKEVRSTFNKTQESIGTNDRKHSKDLLASKEKYDKISELPKEKQQEAFLDQFKKESNKFFKENIELLGSYKDQGKNVDLVENTQEFADYNKQLFDFYKRGNPNLEGLEYPQFGGVSPEGIKNMQQEAYDLYDDKYKTPEEQQAIDKFFKDNKNDEKQIQERKNEEAQKETVNLEEEKEVNSPDLTNVKPDNNNLSVDQQAKNVGNKYNEVQSKIGSSSVMRTKNILKAKANYDKKLSKIEPSKQKDEFLKMFKKDSQKMFKDNIEMLGVEKNKGKDVNIASDTKGYDAYNKELFELYKRDNPNLEGLEYPKFGGVDIDDIKNMQQDALNDVKDKFKSEKDQREISAFGNEDKSIQQGDVSQDFNPGSINEVEDDLNISALVDSKSQVLDATITTKKINVKEANEEFSQIATEEELTQSVKTISNDKEKDKSFDLENFNLLGEEK